MPARAAQPMRRPDKSDLRSAFESLLGSSATPYGYTLTIWSSGALLMHFRGSPGVGEVFLFLAGALLAFTLLSFAGQLLAEPVRRPSPVALDRTGMLHWFAVGASVGAVALVGMLKSWVSWPLGAFLATTLYLCIATVQLAFAKS